MNIKEYINKKADVILIIISILTVFAFVGMVWQALGEYRQTLIAVNNVDNTVYNNQEENDIAASTEWRCLREDEEAGFYNGLNRFAQKGMPRDYPLKVIIREKQNKILKNEIVIDNIAENQDAVEIHKCGIYVINEINFDKRNFKIKEEYKAELCRYDYSSNIEHMLVFSEKPNSEYIRYYNDDFRVDPLERYVVLERGYLYKDDYALVIKDLGTKEDVFTLLHSDLPKPDLKLPGLFDFREWTKDGRYFWGAISAGAVVPGFFRIDTETWEYELFADLPEWIGGGDRLNIETGWVTYHTDMVWTGVHQITEDIKQERREQGIGTTFYIYNLFTKERRLVCKTEEPIWFTKPEWLSGTELEYELPSGEKNIYQIE